MTARRAAVESPEDARLTDAEIARRVGVSAKTILRWRKTPRFQKAEEEGRKRAAAEWEASREALTAHLESVQRYNRCTVSNRWWRDFGRAKYGR